MGYINIIWKSLLVVALTVFGCNSLLAQNAISTEKNSELTNYEQSASKFRTQGNKSQEAHFLNKIGYIYWEYEHLSKALDYFQRSLKLNEETQNKNGVRALSSNLGMICSDMQKYKEALGYFSNSVAILRKTGKKNRISAELVNVALVHKYMGNLDKANKELEEAVAIANETEDVQMLSTCYLMMHENHKELGNKAKAAEYFNFYSTFYKFVQAKEIKNIKQESAIKIAREKLAKEKKQLELDKKSFELQATVDSLELIEKENRERQLRINLLNKEKKLQVVILKQREAEIAKQKQQQNFIIIGLVVVLLFALLILRQYSAKKQAFKKVAAQNVILEEQKFEIEKKNVLLATANDELEEKSTEIATANKLLSKQNKQITDSIQYARKIQEAILPSRKAIRENFPKSFVFYRPRDIVSGDFYWFSRRGKKLFIAAVDCTGHSVPGAFMSMIGNTLLNEIINEKNISKPSEILERLNIGVVTTLKQEEDSNTQDDGMDVTLCCIDLEERKMEIASANHIVYLFNDGDSQTIEGDIFSIGGMFSNRETKFTNNEIAIESGMTFYLFSDGFQDQFGGPKNKKYMANRFRELLANNQSLSMKAQQEFLDKEFDEWRGKNRQIDDVLVIGIRLDNFRPV